MRTPAAWTCGAVLLALAACQAAPDVPERKARTDVAAGEQTVGTKARNEPDPEPVVVARAGPPLVVVPGRAAAIATCLHGKLAAHQGFAAMGLTPTAPEALDNGAFRLQPLKPILVQVGPQSPAGTDTSKTESIGRMTYTTTVAPAGGGRTAIYFQTETPDLTGTVLDSLLRTMRKMTHRQARVCAL